MTTRCWFRGLFVLLVVTTSVSAFGENLAKRYRATMSWSQSGLSWTSGPEDVWRLKSFEFAYKKDLAIDCGPASVAFGVYETNVLWAVVFPDEPAEIRAGLFPGNGEHATSIMLRFAPGEIGRVFPKKTVQDNGDPWLRAEADRIARHKIAWKWCTPSGNPTIVQPGWTLVDVETAEGNRRFYGVDANGGGVEYVREFDSKPLPATQPVDGETAAAAFDEVWAAFDRDYAGFGLIDVDWDALRVTYRPKAEAARTTFRLGAVIADMLAQLEDLHVWVKAGDDFVPGYQRSRLLNADWAGSIEQIGSTRNMGSNLVFGKTDDGIGYLNVTELSDVALPDAVDEALDVLGDTWTLVLDLRFNGGGDETLAQRIAGRFLEEEAVYSTNRYRNGPAHDDLGEVLERRVAPRGPWRYGAPVIVLQGRKTLSSAESFALMLATSPQVKTMGDWTGGSSGNPRQLELECGITVNVPRWLDMDADGNPIEHVGVKPQVLVKADREDFGAEQDAVMKAALKRARKLSKGKRKPGKP